MRYVPGIVLALAFVAGPSPAADDGGKDLEKLAGTWTMVSMDDGSGPRDSGGVKLVFTDKRLEFRAPNGATKDIGAIARVDGSAKPAQIDLKNGDETGLGIYELKGDDLKFLVRDPGQGRATEFKGTPKGILFILKRDKR